MKNIHFRSGVGLPWILGLCGMAITAGCASYRIDTTLKTGMAPLITEGPKYRIEAAAYIVPTNVVQSGTPDFGMVNPAEASFPAVMMAAAVRARPDVFSMEPTAIPVKITVTRTAYISSMGAGGCVSCLTLTIYPLRTSDETEYAVEVTIPDGPAGTDRVSAPVGFVRSETGWISILPGGWIPVPGGKGERSRGTDRAIRKTGEKVMSACIESAALALSRKAPSAWHAPAPKPMPAPTPP